MNNTFDINQYFVKNYNLGNKPTVEKMNIKKIGVLIALVCLVLAFVVHFALIIGAILFGFLFIGLPIIKKNKQTAAANEWQKNYDYRANNWPAEFDKYKEKKLEELQVKQRAIDYLGIDESQFAAEPFMIYGSNFDGWWRKERDGNYRTDKMDYNWFFFSADQIYIYSTTLQFTEISNRAESSQEFFYSDIVSVAISNESVAVDAGKSLDGSKDTTVTTERFKLVVPGDKLSFGFTKTSYIDQQINAMKNLIRQKKMAK